MLEHKPIKIETPTDTPETAMYVAEKLTPESL